MQNGYFNGCYEMCKMYQSELVDWIKLHFGSYERDSWELSWADDSADYFLYNLDSGELFRIKQKGRRLYIENEILGPHYV